MKYLLCMLCFYASLSFAFAQHRLGIKAGPNLAGLRSVQSDKGADNLLNAKPLLTLHLGLVWQAPISDKFLFQSELCYSQKGAKTEGRFNEGTERSHYLSVPMLLSYQPLPPLRVLGGIDFSFLLSRSGEPDFFSVDLDRVIDLGLVGGLALDLSDHWTLSARYIFGITPLAEVEIFDQFGTSEVTYKWYNQVGQFSVVCFF